MGSMSAVGAAGVCGAWQRESGATTRAVVKKFFAASIFCRAGYVVREFEASGVTATNFD
jgi:hypothetical protein